MYYVLNATEIKSAGLMSHLVKTQTFSFTFNSDKICKIPKFSGLLFFAVINLGRIFNSEYYKRRSILLEVGAGEFKSINFLNVL